MRRSVAGDAEHDRDADTEATCEAALDEALEHASHLLPAQAPIADFVHHNTLHAYQHLPFHDALASASSMHDAEGYLPEATYREAWRRGRIEDVDVEHALALRSREHPDERIGRLGRRAIERIALRYGIEPASARGLGWAEAELDVTSRLRDDVPSLERARILAATVEWLRATPEEELQRALSRLGRSGDPRTWRQRADEAPERTAAELLFAACLALVPRREDPARAKLLSRIGHDRTLRDLLVALAAPDPAVRANAELVRFLGAYLDAGIARWAMPARERGLLAAYRAQLDVAPTLLPRWLAAARKRLEDAARAGTGTHALVQGLLDELGADRASWPEQVTRYLLELPGWSGMVARLEREPVDGAGKASLLELLALRLVLDVECIADAARAIGYEGKLARLPDFARRTWAGDGLRHPHDGAWRLFQLCQLAGIAAPELLELGPDAASRLLDVLDDFDDVARRRVLHEAFEHQHARTVLGALADNLARPADPALAPARFQAVFCIDDREEGIRRHFEEIGPDHHTYGIAGFFGVAMRFRGLDEPTAQALCPVAIRPTQLVEEQALPEHAEALEKRRRLRRLLGWLRHEIADASRSMARGVVLTPLVGLGAALPLAARVLMPRLAQRIADLLASWVAPRPRTRLMLARPEHDAEHEHATGEHDGHAHAAAHDRRDEGLVPGFTLEERIQRVATALTSIGLTKGFAPLVALIGHGASTINNPHHSAYECGACGGRNGGPNARALAAMANDPDVRAALAAQGIEIPAGTWFVGGLHDTTTDAVVLYDLDQVPAELAGELEALSASLDRARAGSAHERCRRFAHAPMVLDPERALAHVEERAVDLSQARPELGHATNAACIVGRRALSRGIFLDRRSFLVSYDPTTDDARGSVLERILAAAVPVGAGINLEYYFSTVDEQRWGAGTKLPHNLSGLLGVMEGTSGDLRTGLPRQMIEVHEPVRLLCVIEAEPELVLAVVSRLPEVAQLVTNGWVRVACVGPDTHVIHVLGPDGFAPFDPGERPLPVVSSSAEHYAGHDGFLPPARIEPRRSTAGRRIA